MKLPQVGWGHFVCLFHVWFLEIEIVEQLSSGGSGRQTTFEQKQAQKQTGFVQMVV